MARVARYTGILSIALLGLGLLPRALQASCGSQSCPLDPFGGYSAGRVSVSLSYQYVDQDRARVGRHRAAFDAIPGDDIELRTLNRQFTLHAATAINRRWATSLELPWVDRYHAHLHGHGTGPKTLQEFRYSGLGDLTLLQHWIPIGALDQAGTTVRIDGGVKMPTGRTEVEGVNNHVPEPSALPGTGSWDVIAGAHVMRLGQAAGLMRGAGVTRLHGTLQARWKGKGTEEYRVGNEYLASPGASWPVISALSLVGQLDARFREKDDPGTTHAVRSNTGGSWLFASPGVRYEGPRGMSAQAVVQIPVYENVNGIQIVAPVHLWVGTTWRLSY
jgi:hypothetical protein